MRRGRFILATLLAAALLCSSQCTKEPAPQPEPEVPTEPQTPQEPEQEEEEPQRPSAPEWTDGYPYGVSVSSFSEDFGDGKKCSGYVAEIDFSKNPYLKFNCIAESKKKTPSTMFKELSSRKGVPALAVNAGYFAGSTSVSLVYTGGSCQRMAVQKFNWPSDQNFQNLVYPVRSAVGRMKDGSFEIQWAYCTNVSTRDHYAFPSPLGNNEKEKTFMTEAPTPDCEGAFLWEPVDAVGGGPRLVKDGVDVSTESYWGECLDSGGTSGFSRVPRTAAGIKADGTLVLLVCDGRGSNGSAGYTLAELARKLISLGCVHAMNLDGGGSSVMVGAGGEVLNKPSDASGERPVVSSIIISELVPRS